MSNDIFAEEEPYPDNIRQNTGPGEGGEGGEGEEAGTARRASSDNAPKDFTDEFAVVQDPVKAKQDAEAFRETDPHRVAQRQRQIDFGKNTIGYQRLTAEHPIKSRRPKSVPRTPDVHKKCSKRAFDGLVRQWRRMLHAWDLPEGGGGAEAPADPRLVKMNDGNKRSRDVGDTQEARNVKNARVGEDVGEDAAYVRDGLGDLGDRVREKRRPSLVKERESNVSHRSPCGVELDFSA